MSNILLTQHEEVVAYDIVQEKLEKLSRSQSTLNDKEIIKFLGRNDIKVDFTSDFEKAVKHEDYLIVATPTDYNEQTNHFVIRRRLRISLKRHWQFALRLFS